MQLVNSSVQHLPNTTTTASYVSSSLLQLLRTPWVEIAPYFSCAENLNVIGKKLSGKLKVESYFFAFIVLVLTRQETIKNNNTEQ